MKKEIQGVYDWADSKDLRDNSTAIDQLMKLDEEAGELWGAVCLDDRPAIADELGDVIFCAIIQAYMNNLDPTECLAAAVKKVTKRKGKMVDGLFVKEKY